MSVLGMIARYVTYLFAVAGILLLSAKLTALVADHGAPLVLSLLSGPTLGPRKLSRVEQSEMDAESAAKLLPRNGDLFVIALEAPSASVATLAAQLDAAERTELPPSPRRHRHAFYRQAFSWGDGISLPPLLPDVKSRDTHRRRPTYANLRGTRSGVHAYPSAAEEFNRRFAPDRLAEAR